jgi:predicted MFS family arabinose efflux permease
LFVLFFLFMSVMDVAMNANGSDVERVAGKAIMSSFHGFWSLGAMLGAGSGGFLLANLGQAGFAWTALVICAVLTLWAWPRLVPAEIDGAPAAAAGSKFRIALPGNAKVYLFGLLAFAAFTAEGSVIDWSAIYLRKELSADVEWSGFAFAGFSLAMMIARFGGDFLRDRFGSVRLVQVSAILALAGFFAAGTGFSLPLAVFGFLCAGFGCANIVPVAFSGASNVAGVKPATGIAIATTCGYFGLLTAPAMLGAVGERFGFGPVYLGFALAMAGVLLLAPLARVSTARPVAGEGAA